MPRTTISVDHVARVEGHGNVHVVIEDGVVKDVKMEIVEPARMFESMVKGRSYKEASYISSRICGICSASHVITDLKAVEQAFGIEVSQRTSMVRELLVYGSYLQNHAAHLFVFATPDFINEASIFPLAKSNPDLFAKALELKGLGNRLCTAVGGRSIHPITAVAGGFTHEIGAAEYLAFADEMEAMVPFAQDVVDLFAGFRICDFQTQGDMLALVQPDYYPVQSSDTLRFLGDGVEDFATADAFDHISEYQVDHSGAFFAKRASNGKPYMTAALARINASWDHLGKTAKIASAKAGLRPPALNPMLNNVAQAVELVDALERCARICRELAKGEGSCVPAPMRPKAGVGVGVTEAPRGVVVHKLEFDDRGCVVKASITTPTAQNLANLECDIRLLAGMLAESGTSERIIRAEVEKLIRAYDPCISCSVH